MTWCPPIHRSVTSASRRETVGAKRNLACEESRGLFIAHWDDDDWYAPRRLGCQVEALLERGADLCGLKSLIFFDERNGQAWRYIYPDSHRPWLSGSSLLYTRDFWTEHRFPDIDVGEDSRFVWAADPHRMAALADFTIQVGIIHDENVASKQTGGAWWRPHPIEEVRQILGEDWDADLGGVTAMPLQPAALENGGEPTAPTGSRSIRNVFACLVHENLECVVNLVRNLRHLDPDSAILLYNGSSSPDFLNGAFAFDRHGAVLHPSPRPMRWGRLHDFAIDCMRLRPRPSSVRHAHHRRFGPTRDAVGVLDTAGHLAGAGARNRNAQQLSRAPRPGHEDSACPSRPCRDRALATLPQTLSRRRIEIRALGVLAFDRVHGGGVVRPRPAVRRGFATPAASPRYQGLGHGGGHPADAGRPAGLSRRGQSVQL